MTIEEDTQKTLIRIADAMEKNNEYSEINLDINKQYLDIRKEEWIRRLEIDGRYGGRKS